MNNADFTARKRFLDQFTVLRLVINGMLGSNEGRVMEAGAHAMDELYSACRGVPDERGVLRVADPPEPTPAVLPEPRRVTREEVVIQVTRAMRTEPGKGYELTIDAERKRAEVIIERWKAFRVDWLVELGKELGATVGVVFEPYRHGMNEDDQRPPRLTLCFEDLELVE